MTKNSMKSKVISLTGKLLQAKRSGNVMKEQTAYQNLYEFCIENNIDFDNAYIGAVEWIKQNKPIASAMNGILVNT